MASRVIIREPYVAGQFYPQDPKNIKHQLNLLISQIQEDKRTKGIISPHAGWMYSGKVAASVFSKIPKVDTYLIIGPNHSGMGQDFALAKADFWRTPLGDVPVDKELKEIILGLSRLIKQDDQAHKYEHSIEVQVPFLQYRFKDFKILPLCIGSLEFEKLKTTASDLTCAIQNYNKKVIIIISTDMTHFEPNEVAKEKDSYAIEKLKTLSALELYNIVKEKDISMCGLGPTCVGLLTLKELGAKEFLVVDYKTSGDVSGDYSSVVGYLSGIII